MSCEHFETEELVRIERGQAPGAHVAGCTACQARSAKHARLRVELAELDRDAAPPPGWEARVRAAVHPRPAEQRAQTWRAWFVPALSAMAATLLAGTWWWFAPRSNPRLVSPNALTVEVLPPQGAALRSHQAQVGGTLALRAEVDTFRFVELRVYRDDRLLVFRCSGDRAPCRRSGARLEARWQVPRLGEYQPLLLVSQQPIAEPGDERPRALDEDVARASEAGAEVALGGPVSVR